MRTLLVRERVDCGERGCGRCQHLVTWYSSPQCALFGAGDSECRPLHIARDQTIMRCRQCREAERRAETVRGKG